VGLLLTGEIAQIVIYDKELVNGGTDFDSPGQRWVLNLVQEWHSKFIVLTRIFSYFFHIYFVSGRKYMQKNER